MEKCGCGKSPIPTGPTGWLNMLIRIARTDYDNPQHFEKYNPQTNQQPTIIDYVRYIHVIKKQNISHCACATALHVPECRIQSPPTAIFLNVTAVKNLQCTTA